MKNVIPYPLSSKQKADRQLRISSLKQALKDRVLVLDGAMGTSIQQLNLTAEDFGGNAHEGCNEYLCISKPQVIVDIYRSYFNAGCEIIETNTFGGAPIVLAEFDLADKTHEINLAAAQLARRVAVECETPERPRWVAGAIGPTTKAISVTGGITFDQLIETFEAQAFSLLCGDVDYLLIETSQDTRNVKAAVLGAQRAMARADDFIPIAISGTIEPMGTMLAGQSVEALYTSIEHLDLLYLGLNCATGPDFMSDHLRSLSAISRFPVACVPNAGLPDENGHYLETPEMLARSLKRFVAHGWLNLVGGCCGTTPAHIEALAGAVKGLAVRQCVSSRKSTLSGVDFVDVDDTRPLLIGERTNIIGSKKFKDLIIGGQLEDAAEVAKAQVKRGAHVIDICLANPDRNEFEDMQEFLEVVAKKVRVPLMIDSTDAAVMKMALTYCQGKAILNSINLEDGEERYEHVVPLAKQFGAALVVGCIDEIGMAVPKARKLAVAERSYQLLTEKYKVLPQDIYFDPLVFPCASGDVQYTGSAIETIEGVRLIKQRFPECKTVLGISNVSFGLPTAGREVLNAVFLYHCVQAGLDGAIVNTEKLERYPNISEHERTLCENLIFNRGTDPLTPFAAHFREQKRERAPVASLPIDERLKRYIIEGSREGLFADLEQLLLSTDPLGIINGPLMAGMDEVGRLFGSNQLIVAEVLQSAEVMKAAVSYLEPRMQKKADASRGKILLATVKGDVHDIGKNLVEIILGNNGFEVVNLGIKVAPEVLIQAIHKHQPDIVGLSGLLVKSAHQMVATAEDLTLAGISVPILVGGAALSRNFVDKNISAAYQGTVAYAQDAMDGLELAKRVVDAVELEKLQAELHERRQRLKLEDELRRQEKAAEKASGTTRKLIPVASVLPTPPDFERHIVLNTPVDQIWKFINPVMLYGRHLGIKGSIARALGTADEAKLQDTSEGRKALQIMAVVDELKATLRDEKLAVKSMFRFFKAKSENNSIELLDGKTGARVVSFEFPRQSKDSQLCLSDFVAPAVNGNAVDTVCLFVTTAGSGIRERADKYKAAGEFLKMHAVQALALETAEAYAELLHMQIRSMWGFPDHPDTTMLQRFRAEYQGKRYSFGYPACPNLEDQTKLFEALHPQDIGVELTDGFMMEPEASVSAMVLHHPSAYYFSVT